MKFRVQAQHLQPGDIVGSGEKVLNVFVNSISWPIKQVCVRLEKRDCMWGKYTMINVERPDKTIVQRELEEEQKFKD